MVAVLAAAVKVTVALPVPVVALAVTPAGNVSFQEVFDVMVTETEPPVAAGLQVAGVILKVGAAPAWVTVKLAGAAGLPAVVVP